MIWHTSSVKSFRKVRSIPYDTSHTKSVLSHRIFGLSIFFHSSMCMRVLVVLMEYSLRPCNACTWYARASICVSHVIFPFISFLFVPTSWWIHTQTLHWYPIHDQAPPYLTHTLRSFSLFFFTSFLLARLLASSFALTQLTSFTA